jgi:peptidoglycan hydrolase-like protein with peptidoglycan-binding domain
VRNRDRRFASLAVALLLLADCHPRRAAPLPGGSGSVRIPRAPGEPPIGTSPEAVLEEEGIRTVQRALRARGFDCPLDGRYGHETQRALRQFQERHDLAPTGMPDLATLKRLGIDAKSLYRSESSARTRSRVGRADIRSTDAPIFFPEPASRAGVGAERAPS